MDFFFDRFLEVFSSEESLSDDDDDDDEEESLDDDDDDEDDPEELELSEELEELESLSDSDEEEEDEEDFDLKLIKYIIGSDFIWPILWPYMGVIPNQKRPLFSQFHIF